MYFKRILYSLLVVYSIGLQQKQVSASSLYFTAPPQGFGLSENNIGGYNAAQEKIYTRISAYTDNVLTPISGQTEFAIAFEVVSRDIFSAYMDGRAAIGMDHDALQMEVTDDTLRN